MKRAAFQMDHPSRLNAQADSTFMLIGEAERRGIACYFFTPLDLGWRNGEVIARVHPISIDTARSEVWELGKPVLQSLHDMDVVFMRQDPPFNMQYITATHLLEHLLPGTKVVNHPAAVRNAPEKLSSLHVKQFMPPTLVSLDMEAITAFARKHGTIIAKPLHGYGGRSVFKLTKDDPNTATLAEHWGEIAAEPLMWQQFIPEVATEDMRVLIIDGKVEGQFLRMPPQGSIRANMRVGGVPKTGELSGQQRHICETLAPMFKEQGLLFVGLDLIGSYLTEINVTSPTGLRAYEQLTGVNLAARLWDAVAAKH